MSVFLPFNNEILVQPAKPQRWLAYNLAEIPKPAWQDSLSIIQPWRPDYLCLQKAGFTVFAQDITAAAPFDGALLTLGKHKLLNHMNFYKLAEQVKPGGTIIVSGDKKLGGQSMQKWVGQYFSLSGKLAKNHAITFWLTRPAELPAEFITQNMLNQPITIEDRFQTLPGHFSHGHVDAGSALLAAHLTTCLYGKVADFGAGWGYLAYLALKQNPKIAEMDLFEADFSALQSAKLSLNALKTDAIINYYWQDITSEAISGHYDSIITNPPFHDKQALSVGLGQNFIRASHRALKPKGTLYLVANRHLAYEKVLAQNFSKLETVETANGYKILLARK